MKLITLFGDNALLVAREANVQVEVLDRSMWILAPSFASARARIASEPNSVRLKASPKALVENILHLGIATDDGTADTIKEALKNGLHLSALTAIQVAMGTAQ